MIIIFVINYCFYYCCTEIQQILLQMNKSSFLFIQIFNLNGKTSSTDSCDNDNSNNDAVCAVVMKKK